MYNSFVDHAVNIGITIEPTIELTNHENEYDDFEYDDFER